MSQLADYFSKSKAYLVGVENYTESRLYTPANDIKKLAAALTKHEFLREDIVTRIDVNKTEFEALIEEMRRDVSTNERVLFYFAGHGVAHEGEQPKGFLLPVDAAGTVDSFIDMDWLMEQFSHLTCRHFLLILDCCFAGTVRWAAERYRGIGEEIVRKLYRQKFDRYVNDVSWQVITSCSANEKAIDRILRLGYRDNVEEHNSPFAEILISILEKSPYDKVIFPDGIITTIGLYHCLETQLNRYLEKHGVEHVQSPSYFQLKQHKKGQFIFVRPGALASLPDLSGDNPYRGLSAYSSSDAHLFFGRDRVIDILVTKLKNSSNRVIVVTGASGIGKSSLINAGLKPRVMNDFSCFVSTHPGRIKDNPDIREEILSAITGAGKIILFIDQFEEITQVCDASEQLVWTQLIQHIINEFPSAKFLIGVRIDLEVQIEDLLNEVFKKYDRYIVPPFQRDEIEAAIVQPASQYAIQIKSIENNDIADNKFISRIVDEAFQSQSSLPLLSYALEEWYIQSVANTGERLLPEQIYLDLGGVTGTLGKIMARFDTKLDSQSKEVLKNILIRMVSITDSVVSKKKAYDSDLDFVSDSKRKRAKELLEKLLDSRLISTNANVLRQTQERIYYEPAHDYVVTSWSHLVQWIAESKEKVETYKRLAEDVRSWDFSSKRKTNTLWKKGQHLSVIIDDLNTIRKPDLFHKILTNVFFAGVPSPKSFEDTFLTKKESLFLARSFQQIRTQRLAVSIITMVLLLSFGAVAFINYKTNLTAQAALLNSSIDGNSPSEKLLILKEAYSLDPNQAGVMNNIVKLLNLSPCFISPFAQDILYLSGSTARGIYRDNATGALLTTADSMLVYWDANLTKTEFKTEGIIQHAGFVGNTSWFYYYIFRGPLKIFDANKNLVLSENDAGFNSILRSRSVHYVDYSTSSSQFLIVTTENASAAEYNSIIISCLDIHGQIIKHDTLSIDTISSFNVYHNNETDELYFYDTEFLVIYNNKLGVASQHRLRPEENSPDGPVDLTKGPIANDFPVFHYARDGKAFFYKPFKDSVFLFSLTQKGPKQIGLSSDILDGAFIDSTKMMILIKKNSIEVLDENLDLLRRKEMRQNLVSVKESERRTLFLIEDVDGKGYLFDDNLAIQLLLEKDYNFSGATIDELTGMLLLTSREKSFYTFNLKNRNHLFSSECQSQIVPINKGNCFASWNDDYDLFQTFETNGLINSITLDSSILNVSAIPGKDSVIVATLKGIYLLNSKCNVLTHQDLLPKSIQQHILFLKNTSKFILYYDSTIQIFSHDLKKMCSLNFQSEISDIVSTHGDRFIVLLRNGTVESYNTDFIKQWTLSDKRLAVNFFGDQLIYSSSSVFKINTAGEYIAFDTLGTHWTSGTLLKNTSLPGGNFLFSGELNMYLYAPPYTGMFQSKPTYNIGLHERSGKLIFTYSFDRVVSPTFFYEDKILFQENNTYEAFSLYTPNGAIKAFHNISIRVGRE
ncbi:caspase family protein [Xanthocytophaga agilis]|uniref:Caspase family protein n=1 Tax=Xanthocytophaga agilis TaxID=3048010 RepID=A0AAE3R8F6_9BACT|nr:caspase family protein [Xanthocytophaga agilis]MDJ1505160.1 caspase family protein [Xanthocytophaga agilis]